MNVISKLSRLFKEFQQYQGHHDLLFKRSILLCFQMLVILFLTKCDLKCFDVCFDNQSSTQPLVQLQRPSVYRLGCDKEYGQAEGVFVLLLLGLLCLLIREVLQVHFPN